MAEPHSNPNTSKANKSGPSEFAVEAIILSILLASGTLFTLKYFKKAPATSPVADTETAKASIAGVIEIETLETVNKSPGMSLGVQSMKPFTSGHWSQDRHLFFTPRAKGEWAEFKLPVTEAGSYELFLYYTQAPDYGIAQIYVDTKPATQKVDAYDIKVINAGPTSLGIFKLKPGSIMKVEIADRNPGNRPPHYFFGVDGIRLEKK